MGCTVQDRWADLSQRRKVLGSIPRSRQQSVKGSRVMSNSPFEQEHRTHDGRDSLNSHREMPCSPREFPGTGGTGPGKGGGWGANASRLAGLQTSSGMEKAGQPLMPAPPRRPRQHQLDAAGKGKEQLSQQMTHFGHRERHQVCGRAGCLRCSWTQMPTRKASASMTKVIWRYQPVQLRTS